MARASQRTALAVVIALATVGCSDLCFSHELDPAEQRSGVKGKKLFNQETFGGNGRTCHTCHSRRTGTLTLADVRRIIHTAKSDDPLLTHDALDDDGVGTTRLKTHGTIRLSIPLPPWL